MEAKADPRITVQAYAKVKSIQDRRWKLTFAVLGGSALTSAIVTWLFRRRAKRACM